MGLAFCLFSSVLNPVVRAKWTWGRWAGQEARQRCLSLSRSWTTGMFGVGAVG